jgi:hypothetical protein
MFPFQTLGQQMLNHGMATFSFGHRNMKLRNTSCIKQESAILHDLGWRITFNRITQESHFDSSIKEHSQCSTSALIVWTMNGKIVDEHPDFYTWLTIGSHQHQAVAQFWVI